MVALKVVYRGSSLTVADSRSASVHTDMKYLQ